MQRCFFALCFFAFATTLAAAERIDAQTWRKVKTFDMPQLQQADVMPPGRVLGVRFNYRHAELRELHPHWYLGSIWRVVRDDEKAEFMHVNVMVHENDVEAFKAITTDFHSDRKYLVYGQASEYRYSHFPFLRLIGTKVKREKRGAVTVSW